MQSLTTDYAISTGNPEPYLKRIAEAGFTHTHWCHQWNTDFLYGKSELRAIARWLKKYRLVLNDLHATAGKEKSWGSALEHERKAGIELVKNRLDMSAYLESDVIVMHLPTEPVEVKEQTKFWKRLQKTLDSLQPHARKRGVRIAVENMSTDNFDTIRKVLGLYPADFIGVCFDCGHANIVQPPDVGKIWMDAHKDRLIAVHLHDNDGKGDLHRIPFTGTVDWAWLTKMIAASAYKKAINQETSIRNTGLTDEKEFLAQCLAAGRKIESMIAAARK
ncbi:MAG TPA: sugar phosphate isomerase/epimerase family protein [Planctomycetota bacterium]|nr:sugar phosphate isomerase/epimerase family protein [Planctomycetota bacterium]